uniref:Uncharacterized protein n=1 Tax=Cacopsylla melanoneura TaxID=428564 RepID=A0A8D8ZWH6_9HEMI
MLQSGEDARAGYFLVGINLDVRNELGGLLVQGGVVKFISAADGDARFGGGLVLPTTGWSLQFELVYNGRRGRLNIGRNNLLWVGILILESGSFRLGIFILV